MKMYTQEEFDAFPQDEHGRKICPPGDYRLIERFGKRCSFGEWCSFGEMCSFEGLTNSKYVAVDRIGREHRKAYFFAADEGLFVRAGCWFGTFAEFEKRVRAVHGGTKHESHYLAALELARFMLEA